MYFPQIEIWTWIYQSEMCHTIVNPSKYTQLKHILDKHLVKLLSASVIC